MRESDNRLDPILCHLRETVGIDFQQYREGMLIRRLNSRLNELGIVFAEDYLDLLQSDPSEPQKLADTLAVNTTYFFRNALQFEVLARRTIPEIIAKKRRSHSKQLRIWSAGCSTGEEPYSLAIIVHDQLKDEIDNWHPVIFGTDIDCAALAEAEAGYYSTKRMDNVKLAALKQYFIPSNGGYEISPVIRKMVKFSKHDLSSDREPTPSASVFGSFDLIVCRNVVIYFDASLQRTVFERLAQALAPGGYLMTGEFELSTTSTPAGLRAIDDSISLYQKADL